ncbi:MAG: tetratricopeptide repeat protein [Candidatus Rokubacteria bacterium]|nr:tetratricopeptide repeat protein [Candidatus Rokubacteria bacterium]
MRAGTVAFATVLLVSAAAMAAEPAPPLTREQALEQLARGAAESRRQAAGWLGEAGLMADVPALVQALRDRDGIVRGLAENALWQVWSRSGDPEVDALFALGVEQMTQRANGAAIETFTRIIERKPDFAEGWNKRATVYYLIGEYEKSLRDCDEVLKRNPSHFGALAGYGQIYLQLGVPERALEHFQRALRVNPNLEQVQAAVEQLRELLIRKRRGTI